MTFKIAHCADVHIKNLKYHYEYKHIFAQMYDILRDESVDCIYIGGDIAHTKTQISPEFVEICSDFFTNLANIAPTYVILGNHDGNLRNSTRQDAITPIVKALKNPNLHLLRNSGEHKVNESITFNVLSIFDEEGWIKPSDPSKINIALYHGAIAGVETDTGFVLTHGDHDCSIFDGHDFAMLGDIHKTNQIVDADGRVRYCGSIVQQNHGETNNKGFLTWEINSKDDFTVKHHKLINPKPFVTLNLTPKGRLPNKVKVPPNARLRLIGNNSIPIDKLRKAIDSAKHKYSPESVTFLNKSLDSRGNVEKLTSGLNKENLRDMAVQEKLITEYLKDFEINQKTLDQIFALNRKYNSMINTENEVSRNVNWKLNSLEWDNLFNYGEGNKIDFDKLNGIVGIFGKNYSGKSSIIDSLLYGMFNSTSKNERKNLNVINQNRDDGNAVLMATIGDDKYKITRDSEKYTKNVKGNEVTEAKTNVNFVKMDGDDEQSLNGMTRAETDHNIKKTFGTMEDFLLTSMAAQFGALSFIGEGSTKRKEILAKFLDLVVFEDKFKLAKKDSAELKSALKRLEGNDYTEKITEVSSKFQENKDLLDSCSEESENLKRQLASKNAELSELKSRIAAAPDSASKLVMARERLGYCDKEIDSLKKKEQQLSEKVTTKNDARTKIAEFLSSLNIIDLKEQQEFLEVKADELQGLLSQIKKSEGLIKNDEKKLKLLSEVPCGNEFPKCKFIKDAHKAKGTLEDNKDSLTDLNKKYDSVSAEIGVSDIENVRGLIRKHEQLSLKNTQLKRDLEDISLEIQTVVSRRNELLVNREGLLKEVESFEKDKEGLKKAKDYNAEKSSLNSDIKRLNKKLESCEIRLRDFYLQHGSYEQKLINLREQRQELEDLRTEYSAYDLYMKCMHSNGIAYDIIKKKLPAINEEISKVLTNVVDFEVYMESGDKRLDIFIKHPRYIGRPIEMGSGAEKTVASMAIRLALLTVSSLPKSDVFILDEPGTALDKDNMDGFVRILDMIKSKFKTILLISHLDYLKDCVDTQVVIDKENGYALVSN